MKSKQLIALLAAFASAAIFSTPASALTQREQQEAAKRAYEASARDYQEAARGWQAAKDTAQAVRDTSVEVLRRITPRR